MARINFAKNFAGEVYATQTWVTGQNYATKAQVEGKGYATTTYVDGKISGLGNVFELKGYANTEDKTQQPTTSIEGLGIGDVYLVDETIDGIVQTAEYVYTGDKFEKLGVATSTGTYATKSYVDTNFVKVGSISAADTATIDMDYTNGVIKGDVKKSVLEGNILVIKEDGLFVPDTNTDTYHTFTDTNSIDFTETGLNVTADVKVSATSGNRLTIETDGLLVPAIVASDVRGFISVADTATIDMDYTNGVIKGDVKKSAETGNILVLKDDGLFVPDTNTDTYHTFKDSNSIDFTDTDFNVTADVKIATNQGTSNPLTIIEDATNGGLMVQGVGLKTDTGNTFQVAKNATTVWAAVSALDAVVNQLQGGGEGQEGIISQVTNLRTQVQKNSRNIKTNYENIGKLDATDGKLITDTQKLKDAITATNVDVKGIVNEFNGAKLTTLDFTTLTLNPVTNAGGEETGEVTGTMKTGEIVFAVLDGNKQVYPDIDYSTGVAVLSADYGELTAPATWTVYYGKVVEMTAPKATVGDLTATSAEIVAIETYSDSELETPAQS